jgi:hypothetical protein
MTVYPKLCNGLIIFPEIRWTPQRESDFRGKERDKELLQTGKILERPDALSDSGSRMRQRKLNWGKSEKFKTLSSSNTDYQNDLHIYYSY